MASKKREDRGRNFYETSSPFETTQPSTEKAKTFRGHTDISPVTSFPGGHIPGGGIISREQAEQYDNPRGYPGLSMITTGDEKSKLSSIKHQHSIDHHMEGGVKLARTGK